MRTFRKGMHWRQSRMCVHPRPSFYGGDAHGSRLNSMHSISLLGRLGIATRPLGTSAGYNARVLRTPPAAQTRTQSPEPNSPKRVGDQTYYCGQKKRTQRTFFWRPERGPRQFARVWCWGGALCVCACHRTRRRKTAAFLYPVVCSVLHGSRWNVTDE